MRLFLPSLFILSLFISSCVELHHSKNPVPGQIVAATTRRSASQVREEPPLPTPLGQAVSQYGFYGQVVSVTDKLLTIKGGKGKEDHKYAITRGTTITEAATIADIQKDQWVGGLLQKNADGSIEVIKLNLRVKQKESKEVGSGAR